MTMTTIKSYTSLEQSKKLAEILPLESADMFWRHCNLDNLDYPIMQTSFEYIRSANIPCWSLAVLLGVLPNYQLQTQDNGIGIMCSCKKGHMQTIEASNPIDACYEMVIKLHELNLL